MRTFKVTVDGQSYTVEVEELSQDKSSGTVTNAGDEKKPSHSQDAFSEKAVRNPAPVKEEPTVKTKESAAPNTGKGTSVKAPMPGSVIEVKVSEGDKVESGDVLLVLEAMKMENELTASTAGTVTEILVKKGDTVNSGDPLVTLS